MPRRTTKPPQSAIIQPSVTPERGIALLQTQRQKGTALLDASAWDSVAYQAWANTTREFLIRCFGSDSENVGRFIGLGQLPVMFSTGESAQWWAEYWQGTLRNRLAHLDSCLELLMSDAEIPGAPTSQQETKQSDRVFLVHGRNEGVRETVARFLGKDQLGLDVVILHEQPNRGRTIIEKFEDYADVGFAVVILTGDDLGGLRTDAPGDYKLRARQNVIIELGFFLGRLGRKRVCALHEHDVEIPSDYQGVAFVPLDSGGAWKFLLGREMRDAGMPVDMNRV